MRLKFRRLFFISIALICLLLALTACNKSHSLEGKTIEVSLKGDKQLFEFEKDGVVNITYGKGDTYEGEYYQDGKSVKIEIYGYYYECLYDGKNLEIISEGFGDEDKKDTKVDVEPADKLVYRYDDTGREYVLYLPDDYANAPLVFALHGFGGDVSFSDYYIGFSEIGKRENFAVCYPQGLKGDEKDGTYWNASFEDGADDIGFLTSLADFLVDEYGLNKDNVYACGFSNGGFMSYTLAINASDTFKKVAVVSGLMSEGDWHTKENASPVPILHIHGVDDNVIEIENSVNYIMSVDEIVGFWSKKNNCTDVAEEKLGKNTNIIKHTNGDADVWYYRVENWGHDMPSAELTDFNANEVIWDFFNQ